jgi:hypothetical protein
MTRAASAARLLATALSTAVLVVVCAGIWPGHSALGADAATPGAEREERDKERDRERERPAPAAAGMKARVYQLKHRDADDLVDAVRPLMSDSRGAMIRKSDALKTITARDFPENLAAIEQALKRLDVPKAPQPDVEVQIRVLIGSPASGNGSYPGDLSGVVKQLGTTLSYKSYHLIADVTQRLRAGGGTSGKGQVVLAPPVADEKTSGHFHYHIENMHLPAVGSGPPVFALKRLKLVLETDGLGEAEVATGLTLREGEKVVVGTGSLRNRAMIVVVSARVLRS